MDFLDFPNSQHMWLTIVHFQGHVTPNDIMGHQVYANDVTSHLEVYK